MSQICVDSRNDELYNGSVSKMRQKGIEYRMKKYLFMDCLKENEMTAREFCAIAQISYSKLSKQLNNKVKISTDEASRYCDILHIHDSQKRADIFLDYTSQK